MVAQENVMNRGRELSRSRRAEVTAQQGKRLGHVFRGQMKKSLHDSQGVAGTEERGQTRGG